MALTDWEVCFMDDDTSSFTEGREIPTTITRKYTIKLKPDIDLPTDGVAIRQMRSEAEQALIVTNVAKCPVVDFDYNELYRDTVRVNNVGPAEFTGIFTATVTWKRFVPPGDGSGGGGGGGTGGQEYFSGNVNRTTQKRMVAVNRISAQNFLGTSHLANDKLIGVRTGENAGVDGVEVVTPSLSFTIRRIYPNGSFNMAFLVAAYNYVGKPNSVAWRGFAPGEIMIVGIDGSDSDSAYDEITFTFEAVPNEVDIDIPTYEYEPLDTVASSTTITVPSKRGFDYLWVTTRRARVDSNTVIDVAQDVCVDQIYEYVDISALIGN